MSTHAFAVVDESIIVLYIYKITQQRYNTVFYLENSHQLYYKISFMPTKFATMDNYYLKLHYLMLKITGYVPLIKYFREMQREPSRRSGFLEKRCNIFTTACRFCSSFFFRGLQGQFWLVFRFT